MKRKEHGGGIEESAHSQALEFMSRDNKRKALPAKKTGACHKYGKQGHWIAECHLRIQEDANKTDSSAHTSRKNKSLAIIFS
uniref:CCHC-type domain-containing protein n=1 Tax=Peronospora matthiolae TaxID=2874970 RepID=A0AAV1UPX3_9STRA